MILRLWSLHNLSRMAHPNDLKGLCSVVEAR